MAEHRLRGPFELTDGMIDLEVAQDRAGVYVLEDGAPDLSSFHVAYVGRSDSNLNNQLHVHVGSYLRFRYAYCFSPQGAFEKECILYHDFQPWDNPIHPQRQAGTQWKCPRCSLFS